MMFVKSIQSIQSIKQLKTILRLLLLLVLGLFILSPFGLSAAQAQQNPKTQEAKETSAIPLNAKVFLTHDENKFRQSWQKEKTPPSQQEAAQAKIGESISTMIVFEGCTANAQGKCNLTATYKVHEANGNTTEEMSSMLWNEVPSKDMELAKTQLNITFEKGDALGAYEVDIKVKDEVSGKIFPLKTSVILQ